MLARSEAAPASRTVWPDMPPELIKQPLSLVAQNINDRINAYPYIDDSRNWGQSDYWETPAEFFAHGGGDCEDYAIAKYEWLRALGVPEEKLRIAVVLDKVKNLPHTLLIVYDGQGSLVLDNQTGDIQGNLASARYRLLFTINRDAWWYPAGTRST